MVDILALIKRFKTLSVLYLANLLLSFHFYLVVYINSSFLETIVPTAMIGWLYIIAAVLSIVIFLNISRFLAHFGNYHLILTFIILEAIAITGLIFSTSASLIVPFFVLHQIMSFSILFSLDLFLEAATPNENDTGTIRSTYLTLSNVTMVLSPLIIGWLVINSNYQPAYILSILFLIPLFFLALKKFRSDRDMIPRQSSLRQRIALFASNPNLKNVWQARALLSFFYAWIVIYMPIYLHTTIGFSWQELGIMFSIMLLPFVLFEIPVGRLADKRFGEKEMMLIGFVIIALAIAIIPTISTANFVIWTSILFTTRIGASFIEITTESYFFKQVNQTDSDAISFFRLTAPLGNITAPAVASIALLIFNQSGAYLAETFFILAIIMASGVYWSARLKDTK